VVVLAARGHRFAAANPVVVDTVVALASSPPGASLPSVRRNKTPRGT
jgi:hypothetical protein